MNNQVFDHNGNEIEIQAFHPGEFLQEEIEERGLIKKDVAHALGILPHHLSEIFAGKRNISARVAIRLEKLLEIRAAYWLSLQMRYDLYIAKQEEALV
jgi:addiction module HigA family antidote